MIFIQVDMIGCILMFLNTFKMCESCLKTVYILFSGFNLQEYEGA